MGCGASSFEEDKSKAKDKRRKSSSTSSSDSSDEENGNLEPTDVITKTLLKDYLDREINMLKLELTQPEVVLRQLLDQKDQTTKQLITSSKALEEQRAVCMREYQDLTNLQLLIQQKQKVSQDTWDIEQKEYVEAFNKHKQLEEQHTKLEEQSRELDVRIKSTNKDVKRLLKLRKRQDHILIKTFDGGYGSEKEASIEEYVDKMKEYRKNILNTKTQWHRGLEFTKQANLQFWRAVQVWSSILSHRQMSVRWQFCSYVTNYLNAAQSNSRQAVGCMKAHAQIPYFTEKMFQEVDISRRNAYTACQPHFHPTFLQWLWYYQQNAAYLEKWIEKTLAQTIEGDLTKVNGYLTVAEADLRAERKRLIIEKVKEKFGEGAESEVAEQEAEVDRLSKEVSKMQSISIQANVMTVSTGVDSGAGEGPPPAAGSQSQQNVAETGTSTATEEVTKVDDEQAKIEAQMREEEALAAKAAEEESRKRLEEAKAKIASIESATELLEKEKAEAEAAQKEAIEKRKMEEEAAAARVAAEEAAANAAAEQKEQLQREAALAAEAAAKAKAEAMEWTKKAEEAAKKAELELEASKKAAEERAAAEKEAQEAEEGARKAKEEMDRLAAEAANAAPAKEMEIVERPEKAAEEKPEEVKPEQESAPEPAPNFQSDIDTIMNDYKSSVEQFNRKRGTEEARMDLDLQEKLKARRQRRRQQMKQKIEEQKLLENSPENGAQ